MEEKEIKNKFWKGVVVGALVTAFFALIAVGLAAGIWTVLRGISMRRMAQAQQNQTVAAAETDGHTLDMEKIGPKLSYIQQTIDRYYLFEDRDYMESAEDWIYSGLVYSLEDPYSTYYSAEEYKKVSESNEGEYCGIGVQVSQNMSTGIITVVKVFKDSPAREAGMLPGDLLAAVSGMEVTGMDLSILVSDYIKGEEGTTVDITVYREENDEYVDLKVKRRMVEDPTVEYTMLDNHVGYILLSSFEDVSSGQFLAAYDDLEAHGMEYLIFDLRNNGGGVVTAAEAIADYLLPEEDVIVSFKGKGAPETVYRSDDGHETTVPIAVLVNGESASASEVITGALKDNKKAVIVGTQTFGKGIAQGIFPMADGSALRLTTSYYYTPSGACIHETGIEPDVTVELDEELRKMIEIPKEEDNQLAAAVTALTKGVEAANEKVAALSAEAEAKAEAESGEDGIEESGAGTESGGAEIEDSETGAENGEAGSESGGVENGPETEKEE